MTINRLAAKTFISSISSELRAAARQERKALIQATKKDPVGTAFEAAKGRFSYENNNKLTEQLNELNKKFAAQQYEQAQAKAFTNRMPIGNTAPQKAPAEKVVHASMILG